MFGEDHYNVHLGLNKNVPFRSYNEDNEDGYNYHDVNIVAINDPKERATCIVVEKNGRFADFYYNGAECNFKQLTERGCEDNSWESEEFGITPDYITDYGISESLVNELIEY